MGSMYVYWILGVLEIFCISKNFQNVAIKIKCIDLQNADNWLLIKLNYLHL
jgi:hypothetical protein